MAKQSRWLRQQKVDKLVKQIERDDAKRAKPQARPKPQNPATSGSR